MSTHTEAVFPVTGHAPPPKLGQRVILHGVSWETYERLLADFPDSHAAHFAYDRGTLEIMVLSFGHEKINRLIHTLLEVVAEEMDIDFENAGSTTFKREDLKRGFEPDTCFYVQNAERVRGKKDIDPTIDPPPDLVIEIDISSPSLNKFPIYAQIVIPEVWRYDGQKLTIFRLEEGEYIEREESQVLPGLTSQIISRFLEDSQSMKRTVWLRRVREWARQQKGV
ncbi:MAG TPA: Uma2 family endonuclease [Candidatus Binatia bacterium]|nr:Uma2 family endonuclease [Candidatus Binatia bacterium]